MLVSSLWRPVFAAVPATVPGTVPGTVSATFGDSVMKKLTLASLVLSTVFAVSLAAPAMAAGHDGGHDRASRHGGPHQMFGMKMFKGLELTEAQKTKLESMLAEHRAGLKTKAMPAALQAEQQQLQTLLQADQFDEAAARLLLEKQQSNRLEHELERLKLQHQLLSVLTVEQKARLAERQAKMQARMAEKMAASTQPQDSSAR
jgi:protein CpxP